jgi:sulfite exporter TauE/SafE
VVLGVLLIASAAFGRVNTAFGRTLWSTMSVRLSTHAITWSRRHPVAGPALMGATNGLLPCGLLYAAVVAAAGLGGVHDALFLIGGFGIGTIPALFVVTSMASWLPAIMRRRVAQAAPFLAASIGVLLIARGITAGGASTIRCGHTRPASAHVHAR